MKRNRRLRRGRAWPAYIALGFLLMTPFPLWAEQVTVDDLKRALEEKDQQIRMLMDRMERLEQQTALKPTPPPIQPTPVPAVAPVQPMAPTPAEEESFKARIGKAFDELFEKAPALAFFKEVQLSGYVMATANYNMSDAVKGGTLADRRNDFRYNDLEANQFILDMLELQLIKPSTEESPFGFGLTFNYGSTIRKLQSAGFGNRFPLLPVTTEAFDFRQAYLTYKVPLGRGLDLKAGKFDTLVGLELNAQAYNLNTSRGLLYWLTPGGHIGILASYPFTDWLTATVGFLNGWDVADDNNRDKTFTGSLTLTPTKNLSLTAGGLWGPEQGSFSDPSTRHKRWLVDLILSYNPTDDLTILLNGDFGGEDKSPFTMPVAGQDMEWWGVATIVKYQLTPAYSLAVRGEFVRDDDGAVIFKDMDGPDFMGFPQSLWSATVTGEYKFSKNFRVRLEYRHDQSDVGSFRGTPGAFPPDGSKEQDTISMEATVLF